MPGGMASTRRFCRSRNPPMRASSAEAGAMDNLVISPPFRPLTQACNAYKSRRSARPPHRTPSVLILVQYPIASGSGSGFRPVNLPKKHKPQSEKWPPPKRKPSRQTLQATALKTPTSVSRTLRGRSAICPKPARNPRNRPNGPRPFRANPPYSAALMARDRSSKVSYAGISGCSALMVTVLRNRKPAFDALIMPRSL